MKFYLKQALLPLIYVIFMAFTAMGVLCMNESLVALKLILLILNLALYAVLVSFMAFKDGQDALKVRIANDVERRIIVETGENRPLKIHEEYKPWKGFLTGVITCAPLIILMLIHVVLYFAVGPEENWAGIVSSFMYMMISGLVKADLSAQFAQWNYYFTLLAIPFICGCTGIPYILGAKKIERQQAMIREKHKKIYGDKV